MPPPSATVFAVPVAGGIYVGEAVSVVWAKPKMSPMALNSGMSDAPEAKSKTEVNSMP